MSSSLSLSLELVNLIDWLLENKKEEVCRLVRQAVSSGAMGKDLLENADSATIFNYVQKVVMDFADFLENEVLKELDEGDDADGNINKQFATAIDSLDQGAFDPDAVWLSVQQAKSALLRGSPDGPREAFLKNLLKNWNFHGEEAQC
ncbi:hypothetical protein ACFLY6_02355 [Candidatus Dependentiae bacterium]